MYGNIRIIYKDEFKLRLFGYLEWFVLSDEPQFIKHTMQNIL
jgi:hypothetical protein